MDEFRWFKISLLLFTAGLDFATGHESPRIYVRDGDKATLPCEHVKNNQNKCDKINWLFADQQFTAAVNLIEGGKIGEKAGEKSDRLSVLRNCSLVIKNVSAEDAGHYTCRQSHNNRNVHLFLITMTEDKNPETVTLSCSVSPCRDNEHSLKWLIEDEDDKDDEENKPRETSPSKCKDFKTFSSSHAQQKPKYPDVLKCEVTDHRTEEKHHFTFRPQSSDEKATTATTTITTMTRRTTENSNKTKTGSSEPEKKDWLLYAVGAAGLAALVMIIVTIIVWKRTKGKKTEKDENTGQRLNPVVTESAPQTSLDTADPEDGVSYASISYTKNNKAQVQVKYDDDDEGDTVTYSTVKVPSSSAGASDDPTTLYASVSKPAK